MRLLYDDMNLDRKRSKNNNNMHRWCEREITTFMGELVKFGVLVGLRPTEVVESVRLLNNPSSSISSPPYYSSHSQALGDFRFPRMFLKQAQKAFYTSFITEEQLLAIAIWVTKPQMEEVIQQSKGNYQEAVDEKNDEQSPRWDLNPRPKVFAIPSSPTKSGGLRNLRSARLSY
jgi:hypothetical protein